MSYITIFLELLFIELIYFRIANHFNIIDKPNERSSHSSVTLRGGGIVFYFGVLLYLISDGLRYPWFFAGLTLIALVSFIDDIRPQSSKLRLLVHIVSISFMFYQWGLFAYPWYFTVLILVGCTGILNAYNFMDGINGMTGSYSLVITGVLWYINNYLVVFIDNKLFYFLISALIVFLFFNFRTKAKCFAGDVGAITMAFILIFLLGRLIIKTGDYNYLVLVSAYGVDTLLTIIHRVWLKENIFEAHRKHLYQIMANELNINHIYISTTYAILQGVIAIGLFVFSTHQYIYLISVYLGLSLVYVLFMKKHFKSCMQITEKQKR